MRQRRSRRWLFEAVEHAPSRWLGLEQSIQEPTFLFGEAPDDQMEKAGMDERPHSTKQTVQRAERGQFEAPADQFLDRGPPVRSVRRYDGEDLAAGRQDVVGVARVLDLG